MKGILKLGISLFALTLTGCTIGTVTDPNTGQTAVSTSVTVTPQDFKTIVRALNR